MASSPNWPIRSACWTLRRRGSLAPPTGQEWLRSLGAWLGAGTKEPFHSQAWRSAPHTTPPIPRQQLTRKQRRAQQRRLEDELVEQAWQRGYLLLGPDVGTQVPILVQSRCKKHRRPYISVQQKGAQFASISIELRTVRKAFEAEGKLFRGAPLPAFTPTDEIQQRLTSFAAHYSARSETVPQEALRLAPQGEVFELKQVLQADVPRAVEDFMALWPDILAHYEAQLEARRVTYEEALARYEAQLEARRVASLERQREAEEARKPAWIKALARLSAQGQGATCPELDERVVLPAERVTRLSKEQLGAFLAFLKVPASSREMKANLVQQLLTRLEIDKLAKAQFFEVFAFELAVPPRELETLLSCTTTERKRWTEEQKLPVLGNGSFRKAGSDHAYVVYDRRVILALASSDIEAWRSEHRAIVRQAAAAARKTQRQEQQAHGG
ncbi:MAG TPA: hypothetical protein VHZ51_15825 [Ktedonobacteraceae bacterium]|nr:hypothetical protein [Ktedonobacteraceae bacterium]